LLLWFSSDKTPWSYRSFNCNYWIWYYRTRDNGMSSDFYQVVRTAKLLVVITDNRKCNCTDKLLKCQTVQCRLQFNILRFNKLFIRNTVTAVTPTPALFRQLRCIPKYWSSDNILTCTRYLLYTHVFANIIYNWRIYIRSHPSMCTIFVHTHT